MPVLQLRLSGHQFAKLFPVPTVTVDPLAAAEPSTAALIQLESGSYIVVTYGKATRRAVVEVARSANAADVVAQLLSEVDLPRGAIEWRRADLASSRDRHLSKAELVDRIVRTIRVTKKQAETIVDMISDSILGATTRVAKTLQPPERALRRSLKRAGKRTSKRITAAQATLKKGAATSVKKLKKSVKAG